MRYALRIYICSRHFLCFQRKMWQSVWNLCHRRSHSCDALFGESNARLQKSLKSVSEKLLPRGGLKTSHETFSDRSFLNITFLPAVHILAVCHSHYCGQKYKASVCGRPSLSCLHMSLKKLTQASIWWSHSQEIACFSH